MVQVDTIYYLPQTLFFVWGAVLFGFFVKSLTDEVGSCGWATARCLWAGCLCLSSVVFVLNMLDPRTILGLYPASALKFIEWAEIVTLSQSFAFSGYVYLMALYQRNVNTVPRFLRNYWLGINLSFSLLHLILSLVGASTSNLYWFGVDSVALVVQEILMMVVVNISSCKLARYLHELAPERSSIDTATTSNVESVLKKMWWIRMSSIFITIFAALFQFFAPGGALDCLAKPFNPIVYDNTKFQGVSIIVPMVTCVLHSVLLSMLRRPQFKSEKLATSSSMSTPRSSRASTRVLSPRAGVDEHLTFTIVPRPSDIPIITV